MECGFVLGLGYFSGSPSIYFQQKYVIGSLGGRLPVISEGEKRESFRVW